VSLLRRLLIWALDVYSPSLMACGVPSYYSLRAAWHGLPRDRWRSRSDAHTVYSNIPPRRR
jgi:hypothetical protein